jgi:hypothetical protein
MPEFGILWFAFIWKEQHFHEGGLVRKEGRIADCF